MQTNASPRKMCRELLILLGDEQSISHKPPERGNEMREDPEETTSVIKEKGMRFEQEETKRLAGSILGR